MIEIEMVQIPDASFAIGKYPITQAQYEAVMGTNPSYFKNNPQNPVENLCWYDARSFCKKLSQITGELYRLPSDAEWEYACRAETTTDYYFGDDVNQLEDYAWYYDNSQKTTHPVGRKLPNAWGLHDMHGNVWEMTQEAKLRGGSWYSDPTYCYSDYYIGNTIAESIGFRVVCDKWHSEVKIFAEEMWEAELPEPHQNMNLSEMVDYLETLQTKKEKRNF